ncbi:MAG: PEP-CTERM sorting domain-containing protein [Thermoguttaceae bacterium]|nr:PEP-CTERM sorting domain-containing protein [Thermoguttaceae bacterium]
MNKLFIRQIVFAVALTVVAPVFNSVQAQTNNYGGFTDNDLVLWQTVTSYDWNDLRYFVTAVSGTLATDISVGGLSGRDCYMQDLAIPTNNGGNIADTNYSLELRSRTTTSFDGANLFVGVNKIGENIFNADNEIDNSAYTFSNRAMRLSIRYSATVETSEPTAIYDPSKAISMDKVYLGNGFINNRVPEGSAADYNYSVVGIKGTLNVLPDPNQDKTFRSIVTNNNSHRYFIIDKNCKMVVPEGAKLDIRSESWDHNEAHHPFAVLPVYGNVEGNGRVRYTAIHEDTVFVYNTNDDFQGAVNIYTDDDNTSTRYDHSYVISGNGVEGTGIKGSSVHIECGNLIIQNNHTLNNLSSDPVKYADIIGADNKPTGNKAYHYIRILTPDKYSYNAFIDTPDGFTPGQDLGSIKLTLNNTQETTYYGSIGGAEANETTKDGVTVHDYDFTTCISELEKTGNETLKLYCAASDRGICAESFVISSGQVDFNGYFKGDLTVNAGATFSPDSWNWGNDSAIAVGDNSVKFYADDGTTIVKTYDAVTIDGDLVNNGGTIEFNFSKYDAGKNDVISFINDGTFDTSTGSFIDLVFMGDNPDPEAWATEDAKYLIVKGGGFEDKDYSYLLTGKNTGPYNGRHFALLGEGGNLYVVTVVPEPSTWALLILGAAGLLYWRRKNGRR